MAETNIDIESLIDFRKTLHAYPEISGEEPETAARIAEKLKNCGADELHTGVGGTGVLALFKASNKADKTILFRAELDGLSITEETGLPYQSKYNGRMHACGHDGHMTILIGLAQSLEKHRPENTNVYLLFQPAEETGEGAAQVLEDPVFKKIEPDYAFALHNLPGFKENSVLIKKGPFAAASVGLDIRFKGRFSHAAYPEQGINPAEALGIFLRELQKAREDFRKSEEFNKMTVTFIQMGEPAFGISPGTARLGVTVRAATDDEMENGVNQVLKAIEISQQHFGGEISHKKAEPFAATVNDEAGTEIVKKAANKAGVECTTIEQPISWSEDFGEFRKKCPITLFGLGTGKDYTPLHSEKYDFNDKLIGTGVALFKEIIRQV